MPQRPDGKNPKTEKVSFTRSAADRIARVVRIVEAGNRDCQALRFEKPRSGGGGQGLNLGTFTGVWQTGQYTTVTLHGTTNTLNVWNWTTPAFGSDGNTSCSRYVVFGSVKGTNSAVEIQLHPTCQTCVTHLGSLDLTKLPGYSGAEIQLLGHNADACLQWYSITSCGTATGA